MTSYTGMDVLTEADNSVQNRALLVPVYRRLVELQTEELLAISAPPLTTPLGQLADADQVSNDFHNTLNKQVRKARILANEILTRSGRKLFSAHLADSDFDPYPLLPASLKGEIDELRKKGTDESRIRQTIETASRRDGFRIPLEPLQPIYHRYAEMIAREGMLVYDVQPSSCVDWLRKALATNPSTDFRNEIIQASMKAILNSQDVDQFDAFYGLTSFFVATLGIENIPSSLRSQFLAAISETATATASKDWPKAIFLNVIHSEALGESASGATRQKALSDAFDLVQKVTEENVPEDRLQSSELNGLSCLSVDNSTQHQLLVFYRGPESFFLSCRPFRKASAVMKNGEYEIAVIAPSGAIQPFHGRVQLNDAWQKASYSLQRSDVDPDLYRGGTGSSASGEYVLNRIPEGAGQFTVDKRSGQAIRKN